MDGWPRSRELLERLEAMPLPPRLGTGTCAALPGGVANTTHGEGVRRGVGYAVGFKNVGFSGGFDDYSTARVRMTWPAASRRWRCTRPAARWARAASPCTPRSRARSWASSA